MGKQAPLDHNRDRYARPLTAIKKAADDSGIGAGPIDRFEVHFHANGEVSYRWRPPRSEEWEVGLIPPD